MNQRAIRQLLPVASLALASLATACVTHQQPSSEAANNIVVQRFVDPRTVSVHGAVKVAVAVPARDQSRAEEYAIEALKAEALREHPGTTLLFDVVLTPGSSTASYIATGVAARSRGD